MGVVGDPLPSDPSKLSGCLRSSRPASKQVVVVVHRGGPSAGAVMRR